MKPSNFCKNTEFDAFAKFTRAAGRPNSPPRKPLNVDAIKELIAAGGTPDLNVEISNMEKLISKEQDLDLSIHDTYVYALIDTAPEINERVIKTLHEFHGGQMDENEERQKSPVVEPMKSRHIKISRLFV